MDPSWPWSGTVAWVPCADHQSRGHEHAFPFTTGPFPNARSFCVSCRKGAQTPWGYSLYRKLCLEFQTTGLKPWTLERGISVPLLGGRVWTQGLAGTGGTTSCAGSAQLSEHDPHSCFLLRCHRGLLLFREVRGDAPGVAAWQDCITALSLF